MEVSTGVTPGGVEGGSEEELELTCTVEQPARDIANEAKQMNLCRVMSFSESEVEWRRGVSATMI